MSALEAGAFALVAIGYLIGLTPVVIGLFVLGLAIGTWDVAMDVQAAVVERHTGRSIMSRFHAGFSLGTVAGALVGAAAVGVHLSVSIHFSVVALLVFLVVPLSTRAFVSDDDAAGDHDGLPNPAPAVRDTTVTTTITPQRNALAPWFEQRTVLIGIVVLAFSFAEGAGGDWISVSIIDSHHAAAAVGTLGYAAFLTAITTARWFGSSLLDRFGRVTVLRGLAALAAAGVVVFVVSSGITLAFVGAAMWGLGASLGFPVGVSAGADEPRLAAGRVSVIASIGYCAFLGGPPLIGLLGDYVSIDHALLCVAVLLSVAVVLSGATRPLIPIAAVDPATDVPGGGPNR